MMLGGRTSSEQETAEMARHLGATLGPGDVVLICGDLGTGKTAFVRGLAPALGIDPDDVSSPTFTLIQEYRGSGPPLYHVDLYRLGPGETGDLGLDEVGADGVVVVEWAERLSLVPAGAIRVWIEDLGGDRREIRIERPPSGGG